MGVSIRQFAKDLRISEGAVRKAIDSGRIPQEAMGEVTKGARVMPYIVKPDLAARCYRAGTQHAKGHQAGKGAPMQFETSKAVFAREMFRAKREQLIYEREAGLSLERSKVMGAIHSVIQSMKDKFKKQGSLLDQAEKRIRSAIDKTIGE